MTDYSTIRHSLHAHPQTAGNEQFAHQTILAHLQTLHPSKVYTNVGGWGIIAVWGTVLSHPTIALRADTDALPFGHRCGHDGHTTILLRVAELIDATTHTDYNIMLIWQPAEETGEGALSIIASGILDSYNISHIYALHNLPGYSAGSVVICPETFAAASTGIIYHLQGRQTHASTPELGINPGLAIAEIIQRFASFNNNTSGVFQQSTLIAVNLGSPAFGTSAGEATIMFTLRAFSNSAMQSLLSEAGAIVAEVASRYSLSYSTSLQEPFRATENDTLSVHHIERAAASLSLPIIYRTEPFRWSEDFAEYLTRFSGAMFGIGSGKEQPELHHPAYDFPDAIIKPAAQMLSHLALYN